MSSINKLGSISIRSRLFLGFALLAVPMIIITTIFLIRITHIESFAKQLTNIITPARTITAKLSSQIYKTQLISDDAVITGNEHSNAELLQVWEDINESKQKLTELTHYLKNPQFVRKWDKLKDLYEPLEKIQKKIMVSKLTTPNQDIKQLIQNEEHPLISQMIDLIEDNKTDSSANDPGMFVLLGIELTTKTLGILKDMESLKYMIYSSLIIIIVLSIFIALITAKKIIEPIKSYSTHSSNVAGGDLTQRLPIKRMDEMGLLGTDLNSMTESLASITQKITEAAHSISLTINEVKNASDMQSTGVAEQASSINEITASLEEIDKSAAQTMEKAIILGKIAQNTSQKGQQGLDSVGQSIDGMHYIKEKVQTIAKTILDLSNQTQQVGEITSVVNTLALQSKMLALNASIEAAKAGEAGKGFAVVAAEVKNLAEQSEQATIQVQKILEDIRQGTEKAVLVTEEGTKGVDHGTDLVEQMGEIVKSLTEAINESMIASQQIEAAVRQESLGIEQITAGMNEINQVTSSFVSTVKQTTESIANLGLMAESIKHYVDVYKI